MLKEYMERKNHERERERKKENGPWSGTQDTYLDRQSQRKQKINKDQLSNPDKLLGTIIQVCMHTNSNYGCPRQPGQTFHNFESFNSVVRRFRSS